jgi:hypothetical protein
MSKDTPQLENGFVRFATEWLEEFIRSDYPGAVKEFVLVIARETWGWNETWREIPAPRIAELLGVSIGRVKQLRDHAVGRNLVEWIPGTGPSSIGRYRVQKDYRDWIPQRVTGEWKRRHEDATGEDVLTGKDALSGKDVLTVSGKDALSSNRIARANHTIDKDRHSTDSKDSAAPAGLAIASPSAEPAEDIFALVPPPEPEPKSTRAKTDRDHAYEACLAACGIEPTALDKPAWAKYAKAMNAVVKAHSLEEVTAWAEHAAADGGRTLGTGAAPEIKVPALVRRELTAATWQDTFTSARDKAKRNGQRFIDHPTNGRIYERDWTDDMHCDVKTWTEQGYWDEALGMTTIDPRHPSRQQPVAGA